jgi:hypothetical protein
LRAAEASPLLPFKGLGVAARSKPPLSPNHTDNPIAASPPSPLRSASRTETLAGGGSRYAEMLAPLPRLTSALRGHYDADQAYLLRKSALQSLKLPRPRDEWELARKIVPDWDDGKRLQNPRLSCCCVCCARALLIFSFFDTITGCDCPLVLQRPVMCARRTSSSSVPWWSC